MKILLNNREEYIENENISVSNLIELKNFTFKFLITKVNGRLVKKEARKDIMINDGDRVDIIHLISGG